MQFSQPILFLPKGKKALKLVFRSQDLRVNTRIDKVQECQIAKEMIRGDSLGGSVVRTSALPVP